MKFDIHTHKKPISNEAIYNLRVEETMNTRDLSRIFSAGIHPWDINETNMEKTLQSLHYNLKKKNCIALGECGIDKICGTDLAVQAKVFREQLNLAYQNNIKVLIIHCVKAYQEILEEKRNCPHDFIWILHAFNGSKPLMKQMSKHGFYFSLGTALFKPQTKIVQTAHAIPLERLFLETDDSNYSIETVYSKAAELMNISGENLENHIENNVRGIFPFINNMISF